MSDLAEKDLEAAEVFAYELMLHGTPGPEISDAVSKWKDEGQVGLEFRKNARLQAEELIGALEDAGLRVAKSSTPKVSRRLREIQLIPAKAAYTLEEELRPKSDPAPQLPG